MNFSCIKFPERCFNVDQKAKLIIGLTGSLIICLFGVHRIVIETPTAVDSLVVPIAFAVSGFIGFVGNLVKLKKINNKLN